MFTFFSQTEKIKLPLIVNGSQKMKMDSFFNANLYE